LLEIGPLANQRAVWPIIDFKIRASSIEWPERFLAHTRTLGLMPSIGFAMIKDLSRSWILKPDTLLLTV